MIDSSSPWRIMRADYSDSAHARAIVTLLDEYARGPSGGGEPLSAAVKAELVPALQRTGCALSLLACVGSEAIGLLNAFETLSTFRAQPLINIHDIVVTANWHRRGVAGGLIRAIENIARERDCCKLTLEVLENNLGAQALYRDLGFDNYQLRDDFGRALFWQKML